MRSIVYVIMPVGSDVMHPARRAAIEKGVGVAGYVAHFPLDASPAGGFDLKSTKGELHSSAAVLADLTNERPSCYYEVGLAQAIHERVIVIAEAGTRIHQLAGRQRVLFYESFDSLSALVSEALLSSGFRR